MSTVVTFPSGSTLERSTVRAVVDDPRPGGVGRVLVLTEATPFHPLDPFWPDQPGDRGGLEVGGRTLVVHEALTAASRDGGPLLVDDQVDAARGEAGVDLDVAHVVDDSPGLREAVGGPVELVVDAAYRRALSAAHTGSHLMAFALNQATHELWRKDAPLDSRGRHDLDRLACVLSRHDVTGSVDRYRLGKSLRKKGFERDRLVEELDRVLAEVNATLRDWLATAAAVHVAAEGPLLADRRTWECALPGGTARVACGGTHPSSLGALAALEVTGELDADGQELTLTTRMAPTPDAPG